MDDRQGGDLLVALLRLKMDVARLAHRLRQEGKMGAADEAEAASRALTRAVGRMDDGGAVLLPFRVRRVS